MSSGYRRIGIVGPIGFEWYSATTRRNHLRSDRITWIEERDALIDFSHQALELNRDGSGLPPEEEQQLDQIARRLSEQGYLDSRKIAEAILRRVAPDLYAALAEAGEVQE